jgi:4,4'-diaponeurosporenoate glycosyltransferase
MSRYYRGWNALPEWQMPAHPIFKTKVSIIIPVRNEEKHIFNCLQSILNQSFPKELYEIIVVNDFSTDKTVEIIEALNSENIKLIHLADHLNEEEEQSFKKKGIEIAIEQASGTLILTTDGDCEVGEAWLPLMVSYYEVQQPKFIAAPVNFYKEKSNFERFQSLDFIGMMVLTGAGIHRKMMHMCNGANLAYEKAVFYEVNGFNGVDEMASGDDMMILQKIVAKYPNGIGFLKNIGATTFTETKADFQSFYQQRLRWATKSRTYKEFKMTFYLGMVWLFCLTIPLTLFGALFFGQLFLWLALGQLLIKGIVDFFYLSMSSRYFNRKDLMNSFVYSSFAHLIYIILVGALGNLVKTYEWKGRKVK